MANVAVIIDCLPEDVFEDLNALPEPPNSATLPGPPEATTTMGPPEAIPNEKQTRRSYIIREMVDTERDYISQRLEIMQAS